MIKKTEEQLQREIVIWFNNQKRHARGLLFMVHNTPRNRIDGARLKSMGMVSGVSDLVLLWRGGAICFELKTKKGRQSLTQKEWQKVVNGQGIPYFIVRSLAEFKDIVNRLEGM